MGVVKAVNKLIPHAWYHVLVKNRDLTKFSKYIYRDAIPKNWKNDKMYKYSINRIRHLTNTCPFTSCFNINNTVEGAAYWNKIEKEINNYIEECK